jgi:hypothetical protein
MRGFGIGVAPSGQALPRGRRSGAVRPRWRPGGAHRAGLALLSRPARRPGLPLAGRQTGQPQPDGAAGEGSRSGLAKNTETVNVAGPGGRVRHHVGGRGTDPAIQPSRSAGNDAARVGGPGRGLFASIGRQQ